MVFLRLRNHFGVNLDNVEKIFFIVITFSLQFAAAMSEVIRSAYASIDKGQFEAAVSVGMSNTQAYWRIIFTASLGSGTAEFW